LIIERSCGQALGFGAKPVRTIYLCPLSEMTGGTGLIPERLSNQRE